MSTNSMPVKIAVFDTYVQRPDGRTMHFDILVRDTQDAKNLDAVMSLGRRYLAAKGIPAEALGARECRFCHIEQATPELEDEIARSGYAVIELQNCE